MKKLILIAGAIIYMLMILIGFAAIAQKPGPPTIHLHIVKNINGQVTVKDTSFKPELGKHHPGIRKHHGPPLSDINANDNPPPMPKDHKPWMGKHMTRNFMGPLMRGMRHADSVSVKADIILKGEVLTINGGRIIYFKKEFAAKNGKRADTISISSTITHKGMNAKNIRQFLGNPDMMGGLGGPLEGMMDGSSQTATYMLLVNDFNAYPSPSSGQVRVTFTLPETGIADIKITDMDGRTAWSGQLSDGKTAFDKNIDLTAGKKGVYILEIKQNNKTYQKKLVIN